MIRYEKKVAILGASLIGLLALWAAGTLFAPERRAARAQSEKLLEGKLEDVASIELGSPKLSLVKESGAWFLAEGGAKLPVKAERVASFLETLAEPRRLKPAAKSKEAWKNLELDEGRAKPVLIRDGRGAAVGDFALGGYGPTGGEVYMRRAGSDIAYAVDGSFAHYVSATRSSWLDLRVLPGPFPETDVEAISVQASVKLDGEGKAPLALNYSLRRKGEGWEGLDGALDTAAVSAMLRSILALEGEDIIASPPASAFSPVAGRVELSFGNGVSRVLELGSSAGDGRFHLRLAGGSYVYAASAYSIRTALKEPSALLAKQ